MAFNIRRENAKAVLAGAGVTKAPVDIDAVAISLGFKVLPHPFPEKRRGVLFAEGKNKVIGTNSNLSVTNQRFSVAHELGHFLGGHEHTDNTFPDEQRRFADQHFQQEKEADAYAAELLMPREFLEHDMASLGADITALRKLYQVSEQAMGIRLQMLKLFDKYQHIKPVA